MTFGRFDGGECKISAILMMHLFRLGSMGIVVVGKLQNIVNNVKWVDEWCFEFRFHRND